MTADPVIETFLHRQLTLRVRDRRLAVDASQELFSSQKIDTGTLMLLKFLERTEWSPRSVLDVGSGAGPIAMAAQALYPDASVVAVDRDALAVAFSAHNAARNDLPVHVSGSLGFDDLTDARFDLVLSNIPGRGGPRFHESLLVGAAQHLTEQGSVVVVVVNPLVPLIEQLAAKGAITLLQIEAGKQHSVAHFVPAADARWEAGGFAGGAYDRGRVTIGRGDASWQLDAVHGLPEFDNLSYDTELALKACLPLAAASSLAVWNPGQGHLPLALAGAHGCRAIALIDRDLLALRASQRALAESAGAVPVQTAHAPGPTPATITPVALAVAFLRRKEPVAAHQAGLAALAAGTVAGGHVAVAGRAVDVDRSLGQLVPSSCRVASSERRRGFACVLLRVL